MNICITTPETQRPTGNFGTAYQWAAILDAALGHTVNVTNNFDPKADLLIAIHAKKSADAINGFKQANPKGLVYLGIAGTDIYPEPSAEAIQSMTIADRIIILQNRAISKVPPLEQNKVVTIVQSATTNNYCPPDQRTKDPFDICVIGFMRDVKAPLQAAEASRDLPKSSRVRIRNAGGFLDQKYQDLTNLEIEQNPRFKWEGLLNRYQIDTLLSECQLMVLSSFHEGGSRVLSYAIVNHTPILAAASDCALSFLGEDYPALYPPGNTKALTELIHRAETDPEYLDQLRSITTLLAPKFDPETEIKSWQSIL